MPPEGDESDSADLDEAFEHLRAERLAQVGTQRLHEQLPVPSLAHRPQTRSHPPGEKCSRKATWRGRGTPKPPLINLSPHQSQPNGHARPAPTRVRRPVPRPAPRPAQRPAPARPPPGPAAGPGAGRPPPVAASERERHGEAPPPPGPAVGPAATRPHHDGRPRAEREGRAPRRPEAALEPLPRMCGGGIKLALLSAPARNALFCSRPVRNGGVPIRMRGGLRGSACVYVRGCAAEVACSHVPRHGQPASIRTALPLRTGAAAARRCHWALRTIRAWQKSSVSSLYAHVRVLQGLIL